MKRDGVIARRHGLCPMAEDNITLSTTGDWQEGEVAEVADTRTTEMLVAEAYEH